jgi:hypothetical protein
MGWEVLVALGVALLLVLGLWYVIWKGRKLPGDHVFRASRLSRGNRIFPGQVVITEASITHLHPQWIGKVEESIHISHVSSIRIDTNLLFSDVFIESSGGQNPISCHGHSKREAIEIKKLVEQFQSTFHRREHPLAPAPPARL